MAFLIGGANSAADTGFSIANSCMFGNPADGASASDYLTRTPSSAGNRRTFTISYWVKRWGLHTGPGVWQQVIGQQASNYFRVGFNSNEQGDIFRMYGRFFAFRTTAFARDISAWYHVVLAIDTTQGTESNRAKLYINGTQVTSFVTESYPDQNVELDYNLDSAHVIGRSGTSGNDGLPAYLAEFVSIDGTAYAASDFGEFDEDSPTIWKPKDVSELTFGSQGFYLDFADAADLGDDESGNGNDFTETGLTAVNQATDTPTNNFCTMNPLFDGTGIWTGGDIAVGGRTSEGNCKVSGGEHMPILSTMATVNMKVYYEVHINAVDVIAGFMSYTPGGNSGHSYDDAHSNSIYVYAAGGSIINNGTWTATDGITSAGNYMFAIDPGAGKMWFGKDGTWTGDPAAGSGNSYSSLSSTQEWTPYFHTLKAAYGIVSANFGGCSAFTVSSANSDANGYGNFEYAVPSGFYALCTKNLGTYG